MALFATCRINDATQLVMLMRREDNIQSKDLQLEAYDAVIGINIANMCAGAIGMCLNILIIAVYSSLVPSVRKKSVNILLCQQALVDLFGSIFYSVLFFALELHRDQTLVQQIKDTGITAYDTYRILCGSTKEPNETITAKAEFLKNLNETISFKSKLSTTGDEEMIIIGNFTTIVSVLTTMLSFFFIVTDQWLAITRPFVHHSNVTVNKTMIACAFVWLFPLFVAVSLLLLKNYFYMLDGKDRTYIYIITGALTLVLQTLILGTTLAMLTASYMKARRSISASSNDNNQAVVARKQRRLIRGLLVMNVYLVVCIEGPFNNYVTLRG